MKARKWMLGTAAIAMVAGASLADPAQNSFIPIAAAATDVSVNVDFNLFYDRLDPYGDWVSYQSAYVWVPRAVGVEWRPYTRGHWAYTRQYGWLWVSDEPFGWATYHYGRWGHADRKARQEERNQLQNAVASLDGGAPREDKMPLEDNEQEPESAHPFSGLAK